MTEDFIQKDFREQKIKSALKALVAGFRDAVGKTPEFDRLVSRIEKRHPEWFKPKS